MWISLPICITRIYFGQDWIKVLLDYGNLDLFEGGVESVVVEAKKV
jgi:hypothetical protein